MSNQCIIYGKHSVVAALNNPKRKIFSVVCLKTSANQILSLIKDTLHFKRNPDIAIKYAENVTQFESLTLTRGQIHQGIAINACTLPQVYIEDIISQSCEKATSTIVILDNVVDPHNIGAILRSCAAFSVDALVMMKHGSPDVSNQTICRTSSGGYECVPICTVTNLVSTLNLLKKNDYWCYGLSLADRQYGDIKKIHFAQKRVIVMGSENAGLRRLTQKNIDQSVYIPISKIDSLNVSVALGIALYSIESRQ